MRIVVDTNILVSGLISVTGPPALILNAIRSGRLVAVMSEATLAELHMVLHRPALRRYFTRAGVTPTAFMKEVRTQADLIIPTASTVAFRDEHDHPFLDLLATNPQPQYFLTGAADFEASEYHGVPVISAAAFVRLLRHT